MAETNFNLEKQPRPEQFTGGDNLGFDMGQFTPIQQEYLKTIGSRPTEGQLYEQYSEELEIPKQRDLVSGLKRSILDLEGKIKDVEPNVTERTKDFFVTEAQRQRRVNVEERPLREQYLESLRRLEGQQAELGSRESLLQQRMGYAGEQYDRYADLLSTAMQFQEANKPKPLSAEGWAANFEQEFQKLLQQEESGEQQPTNVYDDLWGAATTLGGESESVGTSGPSQDVLNVLKGVKLAPSQTKNIVGTIPGENPYGMQY